MSYPLQNIFENQLFKKRLSAQTVLSYRHDLENFFKFQAINQTAVDPTDPVAVTESDLRSYFNQIKKAAGITAATQNKILSHLNQYFIFLFQSGQSKSLPTLNLKSQKVLSGKSQHLNWTDQLAGLLADIHLTFYTRLTLLLSAHFYQPTEFLEPGFYQIWEFEALTTFEKNFMQEFTLFHQPLVQKQQSADLFLKKRRDQKHPQLTLPALHKYLKKDQSLLKLPLLPQTLRTDAICYFLLKNRNLSSLDCCQKLHLDLNSLNYYRLLSFQQN